MPASVNWLPSNRFLFSKSETVFNSAKQFPFMAGNVVCCYHHCHYNIKSMTVTCLSCCRCLTMNFPSPSHALCPDNHANILPLSFFTGRMPFLLPNQQHQSTEGTLSQKNNNNAPLLAYSQWTETVIWHSQETTYSSLPTPTLCRQPLYRCIKNHLRRVSGL